MDNTHNYNYNTKLEVQWSHDINFDLTTGRYPNGSESEFDWEDSFIPVTHTINNRTVGPHIWRRERIGISSKWGLPFLISLREDTTDLIASRVIENLNVEPPLVIENEVLKHSNLDGFKHIPDGGNPTELLIKSTEGYDWIKQSDLSIDLTNYFSKSDLLNNALKDIYYDKKNLDSMLSKKSDINHNHIDYATREEFNTQIKLITSLIDKTGNLDNYYTKYQVDNLIGSIDNSSNTEVLTWGNIEGTLSNQIDLSAALNNKSAITHLHTGIYEPIISTKNTAFNKNFGILADTVAEGNHSHLLPNLPVLLTTDPSATSQGITTIARYRLEANNIINISGQFTISTTIVLGTSAISLFSDSLSYYTPYDPIIEYIYNEANEKISIVKLLISNVNWSVQVSTFDSDDLNPGTYFFNLRYKYRAT